jgi:hypothetical protein
MEYGRILHASRELLQEEIMPDGVEVAGSIDLDPSAHPSQ